MPQELYQELIERLHRLRRKREALRLETALFEGGAIVVLLVLAAVAAEAIGHFSIPGRTALFWLGLALSLGGFFWRAWRPLAEKFGWLPKASEEQLAHAVGRHYPNISDKLVNTLQLARSIFGTSASSVGSPAFAMAAFQTTYSSVRSVDFLAILDKNPRKRAAMMFFASLAVALITMLAFQRDMVAAGNRLVNYNTFYQKPAPFTFVVKPGDVRTMRGDTVNVIVTTQGEQLKKLTLNLREEGQKEWTKLELESQVLLATVGGDGATRGFHYSLRAQRATQYFVEAREIESKRHNVSVLDRPMVRKLSVMVTPPSYTRERAQKLEDNIGDFSGVAGTRGDIAVYSTKQLVKATLVFTPTTAQATSDSTGLSIAPKPRVPKHIPLAITDSMARGAVNFMESGTYHIDLVDTDAIKSDHPIEYTVTITADGPPSIALIEPGGPVDLPSTMRVSMLGRIRDDFGFRGVRLGYRLTKSRYLPEETEYRWIDIPLANYNTQELDVPYIWNTTGLELAPQDEVAYVLEVLDNDIITGPKRARTQEFSVRFPSVEEIFKKAEEQASKAEKDLKEIQADATELKKKIDEAVNEMKQMKSTDLAQKAKDFSKQKDVEQILQRQQDLNKRAEKVAEDLQEMTKQLEQQNALSPETMEKYMELQKLFEQINSPELEKAMQKLEQAMKNVDPKKMQEAMKDMQFNEEQFKKSIERTANILKKIQMEQKVDELRKRSGDMAKDEQKLADEQRKNEQAGKEMTPEQKAAAERAQQDAQKELDRLQQEAKELAQDMKKLPEQMQTPEEMQEALNALHDPAIEQSMKEAGEAAKQGNQQKSSQKSQQAASKMRNAEQKMSQLKKKMAENEKERTKRELQQIRDELNRLSKAEEQIKKKAQQANPNSNVFRELAQEQAEKKEQLGQTASQMMETAQRSSEVPPELGKSMGEAFNEMQKAQEAMTERNQPQATQSAQKAMASLNKAAQSAQKAMEGMEAGSDQPGGEGEGGEGQGQPGGSSPGSRGKGGRTPQPMPGQGSAMQQFLDQIDQMAQQQQALNDQMAGAMGQGGSAQAAQREAMQRQAQLSRMAAQQELLKKSIEELAQEQQSARAGDRSAADKLQKIADEMSEVISQMKSSGQIRPETIQRQERILSRLLEAQRSTNERDKEEQREAKSGENVSQQSPRELDLSTPEGREKLQQELQRARESGYSKDYDALIRKYLEKLEETK